ncbi:hypothetical protein [Pseudomonas sp. RGM2987]|uniref:hypothetical protein n=1 Tax=Pseudomonas sp. RGM2987 TaxID=2930090 RepID=UPI001FD700C5|nr:hypothetical protein [Pseudomonas sp. RGM2987]MCJ8207221.1 hypothetical protein [Pseudomonas sp. RGM2987]
MRSFSVLSSFHVGVATLLLGNMILAGTAQAAVETDSGYTLPSDTIPALRSSFNNDLLFKTNISVGVLEELPKSVKANTTELEEQKRTLGEQARQIEELKRNSGSSSSSSSKEIDDLKRTVKEQEQDLRDLSKQVEDLKRNNGSSSNSNSSEISTLKGKISDQDREMDQLKRTVEELSRKVK